MTTWNAPAAALFPDVTALRAAERNVLRRYLLHPGGGGYGVTDHDRFVGTAVAYLRVASAHYPDAPELRALIAELLAGSPDFAVARNSRRLSADHHAKVAFRPPGGEAEVEPDFDVLAVPERDRRLVLVAADPRSDAYRTLRRLVGGAAPGEVPPEAAAPAAEPVGTA
ncbi:hypothetical protein [Streptomyces sp. NPDC020983]|uniref:MmyB family transcriptional regulator n=1 Tax=Streptomyces sp. NPDC020983 TaxID=3365106 RepID=UPI0037A15857